MKPTSPIHLLLRFSDTRLKEGETISAHQEVIQREGAVWFGKMGSPISQIRIEAINKQIEDGIPTYVFLVKGNRRKSTVFKGRLKQASRSLPEGEQSLIPDYYSEFDIIQYIRFWAKIDQIQPAEFSELEKLRVASSVLPIRETLFKSSSGNFLLKEDHYRH
jgi:hypothetical protein